VLKRKKIPESGSTFFFEKNPTNPTKFGIIKTAKKQMKLGRKKSKLTKHHQH